MQDQGVRQHHKSLKEQESSDGANAANQSAAIGLRAAVGRVPTAKLVS
jgi:hypothetical protein